MIFILDISNINYITVNYFVINQKEHLIYENHNIKNINIIIVFNYLNFLN